tara:strand:+ start:341 stop:484 length:144 start_codon:yes stop_codon:yes gene_type:complete
MKKRNTKKWITPKLELMTHQNILSKEQVPVPEQNKTSTGATATAIAS